MHASSTARQSRHLTTFRRTEPRDTSALRCVRASGISIKCHHNRRIYIFGWWGKAGYLGGECEVNSVRDRMHKKVEPYRNTLSLSLRNYVHANVMHLHVVTQHNEWPRRKLRIRAPQTHRSRESKYVRVSTLTSPPFRPHNRCIVAPPYVCTIRQLGPPLALVDESDGKSFRACKLVAFARKCVACHSHLNLHQNIAGT